MPTLAKYLLTAKDEYRAEEHQGERMALFRRYQQRFEAGFERFRWATGGRSPPHSTMRRSSRFSSSVSASSPPGSPSILGRDFFPSVDAGQIRMHMRTRTGLRIEETARVTDQVNKSIRQVIPDEELVTVLDNVGVPYSGINLVLQLTGTVGTGDCEILIELNKGTRGPPTSTSTPCAAACRVSSRVYSSSSSRRTSSPRS